MKKTILAAVLMTVAMTPTVALADGYAPLKVNVQTSMPNLPKMQEIKVPSFSDGVTQLQTEWPKTQQALSSPVVMNMGGNGSLVFGAPVSSQNASDIFAGLTAGLPSFSNSPTKTPTAQALPDFKTGFTQSQKADQSAFASAIASGSPFGNIDPRSLAVGTPSLSSLAAGAQADAAGWSAANPVKTPTVNHTNIDLANGVPKPAGYDAAKAAGSTPFTKDGAFANLQSPAGWGTGIMHQVPTLINAIGQMNSMGLAPQIGKDANGNWDFSKVQPGVVGQMAGFGSNPTAPSTPSKPSAPSSGGSNNSGGSGFLNNLSGMFNGK